MWTTSTFVVRSDRSRIRAAAALEASDYTCTFRNTELALLMIVAHDVEDSEVVRRIVFETEPQTMVMIE
jgi:hypothetical protein